MVWGRARGNATHLRVSTKEAARGRLRRSLVGVCARLTVGAAIWVNVHPPVAMALWRAFVSFGASCRGGAARRASRWQINGWDCVLSAVAPSKLPRPRQEWLRTLDKSGALKSGLLAGRPRLRKQQCPARRFRKRAGMFLSSYMDFRKLRRSRMLVCATKSLVASVTGYSPSGGTGCELVDGPTIRDALRRRRRGRSAANVARISHSARHSGSVYP